MTLPSDSQIEGWAENRKLVLNELGRVARAVESIDVKVGSELTNMKVEIATIKTKVALYAAIIASVASIGLSALISFLSRR